MKKGEISVSGQAKNSGGYLYNKSLQKFDLIT